jgi:hypothetical protein
VHTTCVPQRAFLMNSAVGMKTRSNRREFFEDRKSEILKLHAELEVKSTGCSIRTLEMFAKCHLENHVHFVTIDSPITAHS